MSVEFGHPPCPAPGIPARSTAARSTAARTRRDRCPGVVRPWPAEDGALVRLRLPGGRLPGGRLTLAHLAALVEVAERFGDGRVHVTGRANLQLRGLPLASTGRDLLDDAALTAIEATGLLPSRAHDRARNVLLSPLTGRAGGRADLRPLLAAVDAGLLADPGFADLPGRFLLVLDDGRGDVIGGEERARVDLGLVALDAHRAQLRVGEAWSSVVPVDEPEEAAATLLGLARRFLQTRGPGVGAAWHVAELPGGAADLAPVRPAEPGAEVATPPLPHGPVCLGEADGRTLGHHHPVGESGFGRDEVRAWAAGDLASGPDSGPDRLGAGEVVITPWRGVLTLAPDHSPAPAPAPLTSGDPA
ncbi:nitrite reductase [Nocardioides sp.]|uniref:nitrite reductase n=1 Tax=Nocardioides sp. TaxID=35761 RepID=UPI0035133A6E